MFARCWHRASSSSRKRAARRLLSLSFLFLLSCAGQPTKNALNLDSLAKLEANAAKRNAISGTGHLSWRNAKHNIAAPGVLLVEWPDRLRLEVEDPLGGTLALLIVSGERFWWYAKEEAAIQTGSVRHLAKATGISLAARDFVRAFLARPPMEQWRQHNATHTEDGWRIQEGERTQTLRWRESQMQPDRWALAVKNRRENFTVHFPEYELGYGVLFPKRVEIQFFGLHDETQELAWVWREWQPSVPQTKNLFQIPPGVRWGKPTKTLP